MNPETRPNQRIGDDDIEPQYAAEMLRVARLVNVELNGEERPGTTGFVLMVFPFGDAPGHCNYLSNARKENVVVLLKEQLSKLQGFNVTPGRKQ